MMNDILDRIFPPLDVQDILTLAKTYEGPDKQRIVKALTHCYPIETNQCKALPGYSENTLTGYVMDIVLDYACHKLPALFRAMMIERYIAGGMDNETADHFITEELTAVSSGNFYTKRGRRWV
jgi:hypothetical protein